MGNGVDDRIQTVNISPDAHGLFLNTGVNFRNRLDGRIHRLRVLVSLLHEIGERLNSEIDPFSETGVRKVSQLQVFLRIKPRLLFERSHRVIVEAGPTVFPAIEVGHPVGNVHVNSVDSRGRNLPYPLHVSFSPGWRVRANPHILVTLRYPESRAASKDRRVSTDLPLEQVGMILGEGMGSFVGVGRDALGSGDVS